MSMEKNRVLRALEKRLQFTDYQEQGRDILRCRW